MATYRVTDPESGRTLKLTGDSPPTEAELIEIFANTPAKLDTTVSDNIAGLGETALTMATGMAGSAAGGIAGLAQGASNVVKDAFGSDTSGNMTAADRVSQVQNAMTYQPTTKEGQRNVEALGQVGEVMNVPAEWLGEKALDVTGSPEIATAAHMIPDAVTTLLGGGLGKAATNRAVSAPRRQNLKQDLKQNVPRAVDNVKELSKETGVPIRTTDVIDRGQLPNIAKALDVLEDKNPIANYTRTRQNKKRADAVDKVNIEDAAMPRDFIMDALSEGTGWTPATLDNLMKSKNAAKRNMVYDKIKNDPSKMSNARSVILKDAVAGIDKAADPILYVRNLSRAAQKNGKLFSKDHKAALHSLHKVLSTTKRSAAQGLGRSEAITALTTIMAPFLGATGIGVGILLESPTLRNAIIKLGRKKQIKNNSTELRTVIEEMDSIRQQLGDRYKKIGQGVGGLSAAAGAGEDQ